MDTKLPLLTVATLIGLANSIIYLEIYWTPFGVDIFQFAGLTDFAKLAIFPLSFSTVSVALYVFFTRALSLHPPRERPGTPDNDSAKTVVLPAQMNYSKLESLRSHRSRDRNFIGAVLTLLLIVCAAILFYYGRHSFKYWLVSVCLVGGALATFFVDEPFVIQLIPDNRLRSSAIFATVLLPVILAIYALLSVKMITEGRQPYVVDITGIAANLKGTPEKPIMYLGFVNDTFILYETQTRRVAFLKQTESTPLILKPNPNSCPTLAFFDCPRVNPRGTLDH